mmetsp:Transcript_4402/g.10772  ORF Transcript_4402/g.10772 Transcript_4402/m.10772 type:complete len:271 (+) Transcript_4402:1326-2138(+)
MPDGKWSQLGGAFGVGFTARFLIHTSVPGSGRGNAASPPFFFFFFPFLPFAFGACALAMTSSIGMGWIGICSSSFSVNSIFPTVRLFPPGPPPPSPPAPLLPAPPAPVGEFGSLVVLVPPGAAPTWSWRSHDPPRTAGGNRSNIFPISFRAASASAWSSPSSAVFIFFRNGSTPRFFSYSLFFGIPSASNTSARDRDSSSQESSSPISSSTNCPKSSDVSPYSCTIWRKVSCVSALGSSFTSRQKRSSISVVRNCCSSTTASKAEDPARR